MKSIKINLIMNLIGIVVVSSAAIAGFYAWLIPRFFVGFKTYSVFVLGISGAAILGGICCVKANNSIMTKQYGYLIPIITGLVVAALSMFISLLIILNVRGA